MHVDSEMIQSALQLQRAAPDISPRRLHCDRRVRLEELRWFCGSLRPDFDFAGHYRALRLLTASKQPLRDEKLIKAHFFRHERRDVCSARSRHGERALVAFYQIFEPKL